MNLLSVVGLEDKGYRILFMDKKVFLWEKDTEGFEREASTKIPKIPLMLLCITQLILVNFGIEGLDTFTTQLSQDCRRWLHVCEKFLQNMKESAKDVL